MRKTFNCLIIFTGYFFSICSLYTVKKFRYLTELKINITAIIWAFFHACIHIT